MPGFDPRLIILFCILFIALGIFNILTGRRRMQQAQTQGSKVHWYKQLSILTGIEYVLLASAFLFNISISYRWLPQSLNIVVLPIYLLVLIASGILAGFVIYQGITNSRGRRVARPATSSQAKPAAYVDEDHNHSPQERAELAQKRRERRQKAAAARRRRAGKA